MKACCCSRTDQENRLPLTVMARWSRAIQKPLSARLDVEGPEIWIFVDNGRLNFLHQEVRQVILTFQPGHDFLQVAQRDQLVLQELAAGVDRRFGKVTR